MLNKTYTALDNNANSLIKYYRNSIWPNIFQILFSEALGISLSYHNHGIGAAIAVSIGIILVFYRLVIIRFIELAKLISHFVYQINIDQDKIYLVTLGFSAFLGLIKKESLLREFKYEEVRLKKTNDNYSNKKRTGTIYLLIYMDEEFPIAEKFFIEFDELIAKLNENINRSTEVLP